MLADLANWAVGIVDTTCRWIDRQPGGDLAVYASTLMAGYVFLACVWSIAGRIRGR